jgi:usherin
VCEKLCLGVTWLAWFFCRRPADTEEESLLFVWSEGALEFTDDTGTLRPFTLYEYRVRAWNSQGAVDSPWSTIQTLEAPPRGLPAPRVQATSAHSAMLNWTEPEAPNGLISQYHVIYQERPDAAAPGSSTVHAFTVTVRT